MTDVFDTVALTKLTFYLALLGSSDPAGTFKVEIQWSEPLAALTYKTTLRETGGIGANLFAENSRNAMEQVESYLRAKLREEARPVPNPREESVNEWKDRWDRRYKELLKEYQLAEG